MAVDRGRADLPTALADTRATLTDDRDRTLAAEIATGTLRWQAQLDALIGHFGRRAVTRLDREILVLLRLSAYQVVHLTRVPAAAATDDAVSLVRTVRKTSAAGFVNAVLRALVRRRHDLPLPPAPADEVLARLPGDPEARAAALDYLSVTLSHPRWLVERWLDRHGFEATTTWATFNNTPAPTTLRANTLRTTAAALADRLRAHDVQTTPSRYAPDGLLVTEGNPLRTPLADSGIFAVQDEASQLVALFAAAAPHERVLDCCASPGGKTTAMAAAMRDTGVLVAADVRPRRMDLLRSTVAASGAGHVHLVQFDVRRPVPFSGAPFDLVLLDAPCSGLGTIRRDPEIRWRRTEADLAPLAAAERLMLEQASAAVRPGGRLVYATCSSEPEENDQVVAAFLGAHPTFALEPPQAEPGAVLSAVVDRAGLLRTSPPTHGLEAFFAAVLQKRGRESFSHRTPR